MPEPSAHGARTTAPAPSPKRTQVERSFQLTRRDSVSAPTTSTRSYVPARTNCQPVAGAEMKAEQPAARSKGAAFEGPITSWTVGETAGKGWSGVTVGT